jgi:hypothetical protein
VVWCYFLFYFILFFVFSLPHDAVNRWSVAAQAFELSRVTPFHVCVCPCLRFRWSRGCCRMAYLSTWHAVEYRGYLPQAALSRICWTASYLMCTFCWLCSTSWRKALSLRMNNILVPAIIFFPQEVVLRFSSCPFYQLTILMFGGPLHCVRPSSSVVLSII